MKAYTDPILQRLAVQSAIMRLRQARIMLRLADAPQATRKVRRALKSAEGAARNINVRIYKEARKCRLTR